MRSLIAVLGLLLMSLTAHARLEQVNPAVREITVQEINQVLLAHYQSLSANEQWGVGMGCAVGHLQNLVRESKVLAIDSERGLILADSGYRYHVLRGEVRKVLTISFVPGTERILVAKVTATDKRGKTTQCSTHNKLIEL